MCVRALAGPTQGTYVCDTKHRNPSRDVFDWPPQSLQSYTALFYIKTTNAHLSGGPHLRPQQGVTAGELPEGKHHLFDCHMVLGDGLLSEANLLHMQRGRQSQRMYSKGYGIGQRKGSEIRRLKVEVAV